MAFRNVDIASYRSDQNQQRNDRDGQETDESKTIHKSQKTGLTKELPVYKAVGRGERIRI